MSSIHPQSGFEAVPVYAVPAQVAVRLARLGLEESRLAEAVKYGVGHLADCTNNDPRWLRGMLPTGKIIRRFRELHPTWDRQSLSGYELTRAPGGTHAVAVAAGTGQTGSPDPDAHPTNRSAKGSKTKEAVARNNQASFYTLDPEVWIEDPIATLDRIAAPGETWVLLFNVGSDDTTAAEIRYELSLPAVFYEGYVVRWKERIVCAPIPFSAVAVELSPVEDDAFDADEFDVTPLSV